MIGTLRHLRRAPAAEISGACRSFFHVSNPLSGKKLKKTEKWTKKDCFLPKMCYSNFFPLY